MPPPLPGLQEVKPSRAWGCSSSWGFRLWDASGGSVICNYHQSPGCARNGGLYVQGWVSLRQSHEEALPVTCGIVALQGFYAGRKNIASVSRPWVP